MNYPYPPTATGWQKFHHNWQVTNVILHVLNRRSELLRLIVWAQKRRFKNPRRCYEHRYKEAGVKLVQLEIKFPTHYRWASILHIISNWVSPTPKGRKGIAAIYRTKNPLTV